MGIFRKFPRKFWLANSLELFERWAWYGMFMVLALYLTGSRDTGALGFTQAQKGIMMGVVVGTLYFMPLLTGALSDRFGFKRTLIAAFLFMGAGYSLMGISESYAAMFGAFFITAIGAALFKPVISATIANTTTEKTSSIGFGIFYMMVNIGAFIGPLVAAQLRENGWERVFFAASGIMLLNLLLTLFFYSGPPAKENGSSVGAELKQAFRNIGIALQDWKFVLFLLIVVGFWTMYNQLFFTMPLFVDHWMDTGIVYDKLHNMWPWLAETIGTKTGEIAPEIMTDIDAFYIVIFQLLVSWLVMKWRPINAMITGFLVCAVGLGLCFAQNNPMYLFLTILVFGLGEMSSSPKITEYIGRIAPKDKVGLYMGCSFIPMAGGNYLAGWLSGSVYGRLSDKFQLLRSDLAAKGHDLPAFSEQFTRSDMLEYAEKAMDMTGHEITTYLWNSYTPSDIWVVFTGIGLGTALLLLLYDRFVLGR